MWIKICKGFAVALLAVGLMWAATATAQEQKPDSGTATPASLAGDWEFEFGLYGFMPAIKGETASGNDFDISFNDIIDNLDFTFMSIVGVSKGKWSLLVDMIYLDLSADDAGTVTVPLIGAYFHHRNCQGGRRDEILDRDPGSGLQPD